MGHSRGEGLETQFTPDVALGERGRFTPLATERGAVRLNEVFANGIRSLEQDVSNPFERATAFFLFGSLQQFFFDGNKRTSRFMMNGVLMSEGIDDISEELESGNVGKNPIDLDLGDAEEVAPAVTKAAGTPVAWMPCDQR